MRGKVIITISRQFGSGGGDIGRMLASELDIPFYDNELISEAAKESGLDQEVLRNADERATNSLLYSISMGFYGVADGYTNLPINDKVYITQSHIIREVAEKGSCVILGRCADYILRDNPRVFNVFIHADMDSKVARVSKKLDLPEDKAESVIFKTDKKRASYYSYYTGQKWGKADNYHLSIDSGFMGVEKSVALIKECIDLKFGV